MRQTVAGLTYQVRLPVLPLPGNSTLVPTMHSRTLAVCAAPTYLHGRTVL